MNFFDNSSSSARKAENNFKRARDAELRGDFEKARSYFQHAANEFDMHLTDKKKAGQDVRPSRLIMSGICYTRLGRDKDALAVFHTVLTVKDVPDAFLHAGYSAAQLGDRDQALSYWSNYPTWADQRIIAAELKKQIRDLRQGKDLQPACEAIIKAIFQQDKENAKTQLSSSHNRTIPPKRGY